LFGRARYSGRWAVQGRSRCATWARPAASDVAIRPVTSKKPPYIEDSSPAPRGAVRRPAEG